MPHGRRARRETAFVDRIGAAERQAVGAMQSISIAWCSIDDSSRGSYCSPNTGGLSHTNGGAEGGEGSRW
jgi:hypothetical protein